MSIRHVFFRVNWTHFDPSVMERPLGDGHGGFAEELLGDTVTLAMTDSLSGGYRERDA